MLSAKPVAGLLALLSLAGCDEVAMQEMTARAAFPSAADLSAYESAVLSIGCEMVSESDYLPVEFQTGLTRDQVLTITSRKLTREEAVRLPGGGVRVISGPCGAQAPLAAPAPAATQTI